MGLDVCQLCPLHNGAGPGARLPRGRKVLLQKTDTAHSAQVPFFRDNAPAHSQSEKKPRGSWVRHGDKRLKATGSSSPADLLSSPSTVPRTQVVTSLHGASVLTLLLVVQVTHNAPLFWQDAKAQQRIDTHTHTFPKGKWNSPFWLP